MTKRFFISAVIALLAGGSCVAYAADPLGAIPVTERNFSTKAKGVKLGSLTVFPSMRNTVEYMSNLFKDSDSEVSDKILKTRLNILSGRESERSTTSLQAYGDYWKYHKTNDLDHVEYYGTINHHYNVTPVTGIGFSADLRRDFQSNYDLASNQLVYDPVRVDSYGAGFSAKTVTGATSWQLDAGYHEFRYGNTTVLNSATPVIQDDRNKAVYDAALQANFESFSKAGDYGYTPFLGLSVSRELYDHQDYETATSGYTGIDQSSYTHGVFAGINLRPTGKLRGTVQIGYDLFNPDDPASKSDTTTTAKANLTYLATPLTNLILGAKQFYNTDTAASGSTIQTELSAKVIHELTRQWILESGVSHIERNFSNQGDDTTWDIMAGFTHPINDTFSLGSQIHYITRESDRTSGDFDETRAMIRLDTKF